MIDARDVAAAAAAVLTNPASGGRVYTLTGPHAVTFDEVADLVSAIGTTGCVHRQVTPAQVRDAMLRSSAERWFASDMARLHTMLAQGYEDLVTARRELADRTAGPRPPVVPRGHARDA